MQNRYAPPKAIVAEVRQPVVNKDVWRTRALIMIAVSATLFGLLAALLGCVGFYTSKISDTWNMSVSSACFVYGVGCIVAGAAMFRHHRWGAPLWLALSLVTTFGAPLGGSDFSGRGGVFLIIFLCLSVCALWAAWTGSRRGVRRAVA